MTSVRRYLIVLLAALALPGVAQAKGIASAQVCGARGCTTIEPAPQSLSVGSRAEVHPVPAPEQYYRVTLLLDHPGSWSASYAPKAGMVRIWTGEWEKLDAEALAAYRELTRGLAPIPPGEGGPWTREQLAAAQSGRGFPRPLAVSLTALAALVLFAAALGARRRGAPRTGRPARRATSSA